MIYIRKIYGKKVVYFLLKRGKFTNSEKKSVLKCDCHGKLKFDEKRTSYTKLILDKF